MSQIQRVMWLATLFFFLSGCAGFQPATMPGPTPASRSDDTGSAVEIGSKVKITKTTGVVVSGEVMEIHDDHLILEISGSNGLEKYRAGFDQIYAIELKKGPSTFAVVLVATAVVGILVAVVGSAFSKKGMEVAVGSLE